MLFHLNKTEFKNFIEIIMKRSGIDADIIEKDYYVCLILKELSQKQDFLKAYFKGGTAVYKILNTMNRFSEDIDLTVKVINEESNTRNRKRLKESALGYNIDGLSLIKNECIDNMGSVTGVYKYMSSTENKIPLQRAGKILVEATSFTISEPTEKCHIMPLIYEFANESEKTILREQFDVTNIEIETITLARLFVDKLFAADFIILEKCIWTQQNIYTIYSFFSMIEKFRNYYKIKVS